MSIKIYAQIDYQIVEIMEAVIKADGETNADHVDALILFSEIAGEEVEVDMWGGDASIGDHQLPEGSFEYDDSEPSDYPIN